MAIREFGLELGNKSSSIDFRNPVRSIIPTADDGSATIERSPELGAPEVKNALMNYGLNMEAQFTTSKDRINFYRLMANNPYVDNALDDIVNESISKDQTKGTINLKLDECDLSENIKKRIVEEFDIVLRLLRFEYIGPDLFRQWYVDGQMYLHTIVDGTSPASIKKGVQEVRVIDPRKIQKVIEVIKDRRGQEIGRDEYFLYIPNFRDDTKKKKSLLTSPWSETKQEAVKLTRDSVLFVWSGLLDNDGNIVSYLDRAIVPYNQLTGLEDAILVYRISRAPEKRLFNIEVGDLAKTKAEQYISTLIDKYKNKTVYDPATGKVMNTAQLQTMFQDFWMPQKNGKGTQVTTVGGTNGTFATEDEISLFLKKLYRAMKIPMSRITSEGGGMLGGRGSEISRDEIKFFKFVQKIRVRFSELFLELLRRQLILKGVITQEEWEENVHDMTFEFAEDSLFFEMKESEILEARLALLGTIKEYMTGEDALFTREWVQKNILRMTDEQIADMEKGKIDQQIADEQRSAERIKRLKKLHPEGPPGEDGAVQNPWEPPAGE